jgi:peptidoglycan/LPS O-acetylase OafA/YrhL
VVRTISTGDFEYFSTVTRGDAILLGCLLALTEVRVARWLSALGCVSLVALAYLNLNHDLSISLAMIAASVVIVGRWEPLGALAAIGRRSYALYLWDWPMTILFGPAGALLTFAIAELSYRAVERPIARRRQRQPRPLPDRAGAVA